MAAANLLLALDVRPLSGRHVELVPYAEGLRAAVQRALDCDAVAWNVFASSGQAEHFDAWWRWQLALLQEARGIPYAIRRRDDASVVGSTSFLNLRPDRQTVEIGATFLAPEARASAVNPEAKLLMLDFAFGSGARRVELLTDARNARSQAAIAKLGAVREGVLRRDRITWTGHVRDTVMYSITDLEWPAVRERLQTRLAGWNSH